VARVKRRSPGATAAGTALTKAQLQRRMDRARVSISDTVDEIKDTVEEQYASVKATVSGILDWREQFQNDPIVWSVGALSAGFALGYTLASAEKRRKRSRRGRSELADFADGLVDDLAKLGKNLPMPTLDPKLKRLLGFDLSDLLAEIGGKNHARKRRATRSTVRKRASRRS
jgi:hypothetical protein